MSFRDIVVDACPRNDIPRTLELAREMAIAFDARLFVVAYAWPVTTAADVLAGNRLIAERQMQEALYVTRAAFDRVFEDTSINVEWCSGVGDPTTVLGEHLLTADLLITSAAEGHGNVAPEPANLALGSGAPVLRLGSASVTGRFSSVLVAWKGCPQARRALHDALPILKRADKVTVVGVGNETTVAQLEAVAEHLCRHDVTASHLHLSHSEQDVCAELIGHAQRENADMIVAGIYSLGPLAQRVLGGVTRELLKTSDLSWFMAR